MDLQIELYTTPIVEGRKILSSQGFVYANVVLSSSVIHTIDSENREFPNYLYEKDFNSYYQELFEALEKEVLKKGGNAVINLHIEHNYVKSDKYFYYLLISAQGTAVVLEGKAVSLHIDIPENKNIKGKILEQQILHKKILTKLKEWHEKYEEGIEEGSIADNFRYIHYDYFLSLSTEEWMFVCNYPDISYAEYMHLAYTKRILDDKIDAGVIPSEKIYYSRFFKYFMKLPYEKQIELAYKYCNQQSSKLIEECDLFDAKRILECAQKGDFNFAAECLKARKKEYSAQDLEDMQELYDFFADIPTDKIKNITKNPDYSGEYIYKCINCNHEFYSEDADEYYCPHCKKGKKGLTQEQEERVKAFGVKIETLKELLYRNN